MRYLAVDYGARRLGLAVCDEGEILVSPLRALERTGGRGDLRRLVEIVRDQAIGAVVVGIPRALEDGQTGASEVAAREFAQSLREALARHAPQVPVEEQDERFSTAQALRQGRESGISERAGRESGGASSIDARAAAVILQAFLDQKPARREREGSAD